MGKLNITTQQLCSFLSHVTNDNGRDKLINHLNQHHPIAFLSATITCDDLEIKNPNLEQFQNLKKKIKKTLKS